MADSTCLMQHPFSYTSGFNNDAMEGNHPIHALGQSVSFGRFMSESLDWEKWSSFSHNRYVEEAEKFSRPGSVAQKKAFFEAHYKKIAAQRAAALLEQENAVSNSAPETEPERNVDGVGCCAATPQTTMSTSNRVRELEVEVATAQDSVGNGYACDLTEEKAGGSEVEGADAGIAHQVIEGIPKKVELRIKLEGVGLNKELTENEFNQTTTQMEKPLHKSPRRNWDQPTTVGKKKTASSSSSKLPLFNRSSKVSSSPAKPTAPTSYLNNATPNSSSSRPPLFNRSSKVSSSPAKPTAPTSSLNNATPNSSSSRLPLFKRSSKIPSSPAKPTVPSPCLNNATPNSSSSKLPLFNKSSKIPSSPAKPTVPSPCLNNATPNSSSSKLPLFNRSSKIPSSPAKPTAPTSCLNNATPKQVGIKYGVDYADKRKSTPKSLRMAVNFTPIRELNKLTSTVIRKIERSRVGSSSSKPTKDCSTPLRTPNTASKSESQKHPSATPWSEKKRNKMYSPFSFTPFSLRTEERAVRRKKKLEEKFNTSVSQQKVQLQTTLKEKAETEIMKLRQSLCFKARPLPDFYQERKTQKNTEASTSHPPSPKLGRKTYSSTGEGTMSHSGQRPPVKSSRSNNKNVQGKAHSLSLQTLMSAHENKSPNIQQ